MVKQLSIKTAVLGACVALGSCLLAPSTGLAGTEVASGKDKTVTPTEAPETSWVTGDAGDTITNKYLSRGIILEGDGAINQPYLDLFFKVYDGKGFINSISGQISFWSSINSTNEQAPRPTFGLGAWYEFDWDPGVTMTFDKNFTYTVQYFEFDSPSHAFRKSQNINQTLSLNDSDWLGAFALHPHFTALAELRGKAGEGNQQGWYFEEGIAPGYTFLPKAEYPITLTVPITCGNGTKEFYNGSNFGYLSGGVTLSVPLAFMPKLLGSWTASASYLYYYVGQKVANNSEAAALGEDHKESQNIFAGTVGLTF